MRKNENKINNYSQNGFVVLMVTFFSLIIMLSIALSTSFVILYRQQGSDNMVKSAQAYYAAEAGIEDALARLKKDPLLSHINYPLIVNGTTVDVDIPGVVGGSRAITSQADNNGIVKKTQATYSIDGTSTSFYYGAQAGAGGIEMSNGSIIMGNVFSGGNISGSGKINNNVVVSGNGHSINNVEIKGDALVYSCLSGARVDGNLIYVTGGTHTCAVGGARTEQSNEILEQPMPIPQSQIDGWKNDATTGGVFSGNKTISGSQTLGPIKITGNLTVSNGATLIITGVVYVVGNISISNNSAVKLSSSYGSLGGVLLSDGNITVSNNITFSGSGQIGSYVLTLSTSTSSSAISISNNSTGAVVFYTTAGTLNIANNVSVVEATGYKIKMANNSKIQYSSGIVNIYFSSGPSAGWEITSWQEK